MLVRPHHGGVDRDVPVDLTRRVRRSLDLLEQTLPRPVCRPQPVPFVDGFPWTEPFGQVTPLHTGPGPVQDPVDHLPMVRDRPQSLLLTGKNGRSRSRSASLRSPRPISIPTARSQGSHMIGLGWPVRSGVTPAVGR